VGPIAHQRRNFLSSRAAFTVVFIGIEVSEFIGLTHVGEVVFDCVEAIGDVLLIRSQAPLLTRKFRRVISPSEIEDFLAICHYIHP
jgi:hypothetical protein